MTEAEGRFRERRSAHASGEEAEPRPDAGPAETAGRPGGKIGLETSGPDRPAIEVPGAAAGERREPEPSAPAGRPFPEAALLEVIQYVVVRVSQCLGEIPLDETGEKRFLPQEARAYIDLLAVLAERTGSDLSGPTSDALDNLIADLRARYLELS